MQTGANMSPEDVAKNAKRLEGPQRGGLAERANAQCPGGYDIVARSAPDYGYGQTLANGMVMYKLSQVFTIVCR